MASDYDTGFADESPRLPTDSVEDVDRRLSRLYVDLFQPLTDGVVKVEEGIQDKYITLQNKMNAAFDKTHRGIAAFQAKYPITTSRVVPAPAVRAGTVTPGEGDLVSPSPALAQSPSTTIADLGSSLHLPPPPPPPPGTETWYGVYHCANPCSCHLMEFVVRPSIGHSQSPCPQTFGFGGQTCNLIYCSLDVRAANLALQRCLFQWCRGRGIQTPDVGVHTPSIGAVVSADSPNLLSATGSTVGSIDTTSASIINVGNTAPDMWGYWCYDNGFILFRTSGSPPIWMDCEAFLFGTPVNPLPGLYKGGLNPSGQCSGPVNKLGNRVSFSNLFSSIGAAIKAAENCKGPGGIIGGGGDDTIGGGGIATTPPDCPPCKPCPPPTTTPPKDCDTRRICDPLNLSWPEIFAMELGIGTDKFKGNTLAYFKSLLEPLKKYPTADDVHKLAEDTLLKAMDDDGVSRG